MAPPKARKLSLPQGARRRGLMIQAAAATQTPPAKEEIYPETLGSLLVAYTRFVKWQKRFVSTLRSPFYKTNRKISQLVDKDFLYRYKRALKEGIIEASDTAFAAATQTLLQHMITNPVYRRKKKQQARALSRTKSSPRK
ncbi:hypothetical protein N0V83_000536 [Neocucurbitaria cava]|uniref:Uncharacterized protein n=1 Tax=Neocucurbitaria cava TaxID=798079 RepID=A0A9W9CS41_9PLEO|nr:hypothetical protein N0V83_000536 [Neocucurbitaria cava]